MVKIVPGKTIDGNAGGIFVLAGKEQKPRFLHGAIAIPLADFPSGVCWEECADSLQNRFKNKW